MSDDAHHTIKAVAKRTGLSAHVIRIWEKRYGAVEPNRTDTNRRLYSEAEIERLTLLKDLTHAGHSIGAIAQLPAEKLRRMLLETLPSGTAAAPAPLKDATPSLLDEAVSAVTGLNAARLEAVLKRGSVELGNQGVLQKVIAPLAQRIGELWREGTITAAHEHFASGLIRLFLGHAARSFAAGENAPVLIVATPHGQLHELGALLAAAAAANLGWHVVYLGASLPAAEIAGIARQSAARAVALSVVYPEDDPNLPGELQQLRELIPDEIPVLIGGRAAPAYRNAIQKIAALEITDLAHLSATLDRLRKPGPKRK